MQKVIPFCKATLDDEEIKAVNKVIKSGWLAAGSETEAFEEEFAKYVGVKYAIFTNSCTSALKMAYKYYKEKGYRFYLTPINTFCATYSSAEEMKLMDPKNKVEICIPNARYTGTVDDYNRLPNPKGYIEIKKEKIIKVNVHYGSVKDETPCLIEDSAHRIEPSDPLVGKIRCYSFYVTKNMTTGSGGMFVTNNKEIYEKARLYWKDGIDKSTFERQHGGWNYQVRTMAGGYDGNDLAAAMGRVQLRKLPNFNKRRNEIRERYNNAFGKSWGGNHLYPYFVDKEEKIGQLIEFLNNNGIKSGYHYPNTGWLGVSLPIYPLLTDKEQKYIIKNIKRWEREQIL
jgi:dTDP-4-amino-4,6-dideoxygalactose transaminase